MVVFTQNEKVDMLLIYGESKRNAYQAERLYAERYPGRHHPCRKYFKILEEKFRAQPNENEQNTFIIDEATEINVLASVEINKNASTREIGSALDISRESVRRILRKHGYKSYKYQLHQHLYEADAGRRVHYCNWLLENRNIVSRILFTDESRFTNNGMFNRNNLRYWSQENLHEFKEGNHQEVFGVNVWAGIVGTRIIGPILFQGTLNGIRYLNFLENEIEGFLGELPMNLRRSIYYQQDGAPTHNLRDVSNYLENRFQNKVISTYGHTRWPARSPDLTPMDFFLWGYVKERVYSSSSRNLQELEIKIRQAFATITAQMLERVVRETISRAQKCTEVEGMHFEQLL